MILSQCTIVFCRISSFNILIPNSLLDFILYYILELINISTHVALLTMNYMVRTLLFSLQYIRYLYVNVFIYACFWYLLLLKYIIIIQYKQPFIQQILHAAFDPLGVRQHFPCDSNS